jgi:ABC-type sugar transport system, periplasmic component
MKKILSLLLAGTMVAGMLTGCQGSSTKNPTATTSANAAASEKKDPVTLRFSWWGGDTRAEATLKVIKQFQEKYPNITIKPEYGGSEGYNDKISTQLSAGTAPDIIQLANNMPAYYKAQGADYFVDLKKSGFNFSKFEENYLNMRINGNIDNVQIGIPTGVASSALLYNKDLANKIGIDLKGAKTWDDIIVAGKKVQQYDPNMYLLCMNTNYLTNLVFKPYFIQITGKTFVDEDTKSFVMNQENLQKSLQLIQDLYKNKVVAPASYSAAYPGDKLQTDPNWIAGKYVGGMTYISTIEVMTAANKNANYEVGQLPIMKDAKLDGYMSNCPQIMVINNKSKNVKEAASFLDYFFNDKTAMETLKTERSVPPTAEARAVLAEKGLLNPLLQQSADIAMKYKGAIGDRYTDNSEGQAVFEQAVESIGYGASDPAKAAANILSLFKNIIK